MQSAPRPQKNSVKKMTFFIDRNKSNPDPIKTVHATNLSTEAPKSYADA
jgi:hypothetical protein